MSVENSVVRAIEVAVGAAPDDVALRVHLATLLNAAARPAEALEHAAYALALQPAHLGALQAAAEAAETLGDTARTLGYRTLLTALGGAPPAAPPTAPPPAAATAPAPDPYDLGLLASLSSPAPVESTREAPASNDDEQPERYLEFDPDDDPDTESVFEVERPEMRLRDVAGLQEVKRRLEVSFLGPLRSPELRAMYRKSLRGGLLLFGPPGCGKTFIARALAGELGAKFISIGLADVVDSWYGGSEKRLQRLFDTARRNAPCVLFFDEIDALGHKRSQLRGSGGRNVVNQLLSEMDSVGANNEGVFVLAATNCPWDVDAALRRPGRFDRMMLVLPPDPDARQAALVYHMRERPADAIDYAWLASRTECFSGADLEHLCESATESALEQSMRTGKPLPIRMDDFRRALRDVRPTTRAWLDQAKNYAMFANEDGAYDDLLAYLKSRRI
ncbi:MAG: Cell division protein FtsH [Armatimonadetes bacterium]|jgi:SpoVK/Ycf46/Vps4 family AAA+-type ATPase|nr:Cell division protein FtsH [Armatimonadota bacterium]